MAISTCRACGAVFQSTSAFDEHRVGKFELRDKKGRAVVQRNTRRCMTVAEMRTHGMQQNERGRWYEPIDEAARVRLEHKWKHPVSVSQMTMAL